MSDNGTGAFGEMGRALGGASHALGDAARATDTANICPFFILGRCIFGDDCRRSHPAGALPNIGILCRYFMAGRCKKGAACKFEHHVPGQSSPVAVRSSVQDEVRPAASNAVAPDANPNIGRPCGLFELGRCNKGAACEFAHRDPGQPSSAFQVQEALQKAVSVPSATVRTGIARNDSDKKLCRFHMTGICRYGVSCWFAHGTLCDLCGLNALHPHNEDEAEAHLQSCLVHLEEKQIARQGAKTGNAN